jgi:hypothetical protein
VFSVDLRPGLVHDARKRLATMGYRPVLHAGDGSRGLPDHAPYDRIIATCSVATIPPEWIEQTAPGGLILVDVEGQLSAGNLVVLRRGDEPLVEGKFLDWYGRFMALRHDAASVGQPWPTVDRSDGDERITTVDPVELDGEPGLYRVRRAGPQDLWADVEQAHDEWAAMGTPAWHRFGLTATATTQRVWLDSPDSAHTWNLDT